MRSRTKPRNHDAPGTTLRDTRSRQSVFLDRMLWIAQLETLNIALLLFVQQSLALAKTPSSNADTHWQFLETEGSEM